MKSIAFFLVLLVSLAACDYIKGHQRVSGTVVDFDTVERFVGGAVIMAVQEENGTIHNLGFDANDYVHTPELRVGAKIEVVFTTNDSVTNRKTSRPQKVTDEDGFTRFENKDERIMWWKIIKFRILTTS